VPTTATPGALLVAVPPLADPNFRRTLILLCDHTTEGSFGLVLNRPTGLSLAQVLDDTALGFDAPLWSGGPVQTDTLHYLHAFGDAVDGALPVLDGVQWGGAFDALCEGLADEHLDAERVRFFAGYSGWGPGQLDAEVDDGAWIVLDADASLVFDDRGDTLWRSVLRRLGGEYAILSTFPDDPQMN